MNYIGYIKKLLNQPIGAVPVGLSVNIAGVKLGFERQFEIDGKIRLDVVSDRKKVVSIDGVLKNKPKQVKKINDFILKNRTVFRTKVEKGYGTRKKIKEFEVTEKDIKEKTKKLVDNLSKEVRDYNNPKKTTSKKTTSRKTTEKKINPDRAGFLFRYTKDGIIQLPKINFQLYKNDKLPGVKMFVGKIDNWYYVLELTTGRSIADGPQKKLAIESADRIIKNNSVEKIKSELKKNKLPKKYIDTIMLPYDYVKKQSSKKSTPKKSPPKKSYVIESKGWNKIRNDINKRKKEVERLEKKLKKTKKSTPKKESNKRVITKKGKAGNLVYVGREKVGKKMLYQYEYKNIPKKK